MTLGRCAEGGDSSQLDLWYLWLPVMESVRQDPGLVELVHDIGLVDYWEEYGWGDFCARTASCDIVCK